MSKIQSPAFQTKTEQYNSNCNQQTSHQSKVNLSQKSDSFEISTKQENTNNKKNILKKIAIGAGIALAIAGTVFAIKNGKSVKLSDVKFDKGVASLADGSKFNGKIKDTLKGGDKIVLEYKDGVLQKSIRSGSKNIAKTFKTAENGDKLVKIKIGKIVREANITKTENLCNIFQNAEFKISGTGETTTCQGLFDKYLKDYNISGKTLYHGTGYETAEAINKSGITSSYRAEMQGKFNGAYFTEDINIAKKYAQQAADKGTTSTAFFAGNQIKVTSGGIIQATMPKDSKLAKFANDEGKFLSINLKDDITSGEGVAKALKEKGIEKRELISYIQDRLRKKGYDGILDYEAHTGKTPIIFNRDKLNYGEIIKI